MSLRLLCARSSAPHTLVLSVLRLPQALFDVSNPFLHTAKMLNTIGLPKVRGAQRAPVLPRSVLMQRCECARGTLVLKRQLNTLPAPHCAAQTEAIKWPVFALFALLFFAARIAAAPISIVWPAVKYSSRVRGAVCGGWWRARAQCCCPPWLRPPSLQVLPGANNVVLTLMLAIVCGIQWFFFYKIVRMAAGADKPESPRQAGAKKAQ